MQQNVIFYRLILLLLIVSGNLVSMQSRQIAKGVLNKKNYHTSSTLHDFKDWPITKNAIEIVKEKLEQKKDNLKAMLIRDTDLEWLLKHEYNDRFNTYTYEPGLSDPYTKRVSGSAALNRDTFTFMKKIVATIAITAITGSPFCMLPVIPQTMHVYNILRSKMFFHNVDYKHLLNNHPVDVLQWAQRVSLYWGRSEEEKVRELYTLACSAREPIVQLENETIESYTNRLIQQKELIKQKDENLFKGFYVLLGCAGEEEIKKHSLDKLLDLSAQYSQDALDKHIKYCEKRLSRLDNLDFLHDLNCKLSNFMAPPMTIVSRAVSLYGIAALASGDFMNAFTLLCASRPGIWHNKIRGGMHNLSLSEDKAHYKIVLDLLKIKKESIEAKKITNE